MRRPRGTLALLLLLLAPPPGSAGERLSPEEDAALRSEWETARARQEQVVRDNDRRIAEIHARDGGTDETARALRITRDRAAAASSGLKGAGRGRILARTAETADGDARALAELSAGQADYVDGALREWGDGPERKKAQDAAALLQRNLDRARSNLTRATGAVTTMTTQLPQSGVLEQVTHIEAAAKEAGARLAARWERERAAREREREQREREAGERAREQRR